MPESTFAATFAELQAEVGGFLGYGRGAGYGESEWSARQQGNIDSCVKAGVHNFYFPEPLPGESASHNWSFLLPTATLDLAEGGSVVRLPDDFGAFEGKLYNVTSGTVLELDLRDKSYLDRLYAASPDATGAPQYAAERPTKGTTAQRSNRSELYVYPAADGAYTLRGSYYLLPNILDGSHPYCYGGAEHGQTVIEGCLAVAEERFVNESSIHRGAYARRLAASVSLDRRHKPQRLGVMADADGLGGRESGWTGLPGVAVTVNGVRY